MAIDYSKSGRSLQKSFSSSERLTGRLIRGGVKFGPQKVGGKLGGAEGYGSGSGTTMSGYLGPKQRVSPTRRGRI